MRHQSRASESLFDVTAENHLASMPFWQRATYGGNTSCVEVRCGKEIIVLDLGSGLRLFGNSVFGDMKKSGGLTISFLLSHVHWDHIQGIPFFGPLYINKESDIKNSWCFYGGTNYIETAEACLRGQMDHPVFPVSWKEIKAITHKMHTDSLYDRKSFSIGDAHIKTRKLNHPQETYGWRIEYGGKVLVYTTDNEPFDPMYPDPRLLDLAKNADLWITDCQYTKDVYEGKVDGVPRHGWGHSYPEAVARTATLAGVKHTVLFHHDPGSSDEQIFKMEEFCKSIVGTGQKVSAAYEGMEIIL